MSGDDAWGANRHRRLRPPAVGATGAGTAEGTITRTRRGGVEAEAENGEDTDSDVAASLECVHGSRRGNCRCYVLY